MCDFIVTCVDRNVTPKVVIPVGSDIVPVRARSERPNKPECISKHQSRMALGDE